jgi:hypothetical protein
VRLAAALVLLTALGGCVSANGCAESIPEDLRADAIRFALDRELVKPELVPHDALTLGYEKGRPYEELSEDRRRLLAPYAVNYATCLRERVDRR